MSFNLIHLVLLAVGPLMIVLIWILLTIRDVRGGVYRQLDLQDEQLMVLNDLYAFMRRQAAEGPPAPPHPTTEPHSD